MGRCLMTVIWEGVLWQVCKKQGRKDIQLVPSQVGVGSGSGVGCGG